MAPASASFVCASSANVFQTASAQLGCLVGSVLWITQARFVGVSSNVLYRSDDQGRTWSAPKVIANGTKQTRDYYEPGLVEVDQDHLVALHRVGRCQDGRYGLFWQNESRDGGQTWTEPRETNITSGACPRMIKLSDGRLLLTFGRRYKPFGLYARISEDAGRTWSHTSWLLRAAPDGNQGYSSSVELEPGTIFTACYGRNPQGITGITGTFWKTPS